jgi:aromatic-L-amino-acid/L-tryptophan decarboxylase
MDAEQFRRAGYQVIDWIADYRTQIADLPVAPAASPSDVRDAVDGLLGAPTDIASLLDALDERVVPYQVHTQHPRHAGWFPSNASLSSVLGDLAGAGLGTLGISWASAPALTELELAVTSWLRDEAGLDGQWQGSIADTASTCALAAMIVARERATAGASGEHGLAATGQRLRVYASGEAHSSIVKAVVLAGLGRQNLVPIRQDPASRGMDVAALAEAVAADRAAGFVPAAIVATIGTTATTAIDPIAPIVEFARGQDIYVHVDAALAGAALLLPEMRSIADGVDGADSLCWNPHKWMGTVLDTSLMYWHNVAEVEAVMSTDPSYLASKTDGSVVQLRDWGIPLGRRFRALRLLFQLRLDGLDEIRGRLRRDLAHARRLAELIASEPHWQVVAPTTLQTVVAVYGPSGPGADAATRAWVAAVNDSGRAHLTTAEVDGRLVVRVSLGVLSTEWDDVAAIWDAMREAAAREGSTSG